MEGFKPELSKVEWERKETGIPVIDATLKRCEALENNSEILEKIELYLKEYLREEIDNTNIFSSERFDASFAYTVVRLRDIAKNIFERLGLQTTERGEASEEEVGGHSKKEVIFGTSFSIGVGHPYHWIEHGMDQIAKKMPESLRRLSQGQEPEDLEIYGVGSPSGELGMVSDEFLKEVGDRPFEKIGELYAEFVSQLNLDDEGKKVIDLWGVSMGASFAATTANSLIENNQATQDAEESEKENVPLVRTIMYMPVGTSESPFKKWQIPLGFGVEALYSLATDKYARELSGPGQKEFVANISNRLAEKGITARLSKEDIENKQSLIWKSINQLRNGIPVAEGLKTNEVIGIYDPLMYPANLESDGNRRKFGIMMTHTPAIVRENYFKRLINAGEEMKNLETNT